MPFSLANCTGSTLDLMVKDHETQKKRFCVAMTSFLQSIQSAHGGNAQMECALQMFKFMGESPFPWEHVCGELRATVLGKLDYWSATMPPSFSKTAIAHLRPHLVTKTVA